MITTSKKANKSTWTIIFFFLIVSNANSQQRAVLHIRTDGRQELVPLHTNEEVAEVINRLDNKKQLNKPLAVIDSLRYNQDSEMNSRVGFSALDIAFQWYAIPNSLILKEFWWKNGVEQGAAKRADIRVWRADRRLLDIPNTAVNSTGHLGYYDHNCDSCDYTITAFKADTDSVLKTMNDLDTTHLFFDPLAIEWLLGRREVALDSNKWQHINFESNGQEDLSLNELEPFGFTIQNKSLLSQGDDKMEIWASELSGYDSTEYFSPYHSMKFYTYPFSSDSTIGWQIKGYDWGMYAVVELLTESSYVSFTFLDPQSPVPSESETRVSVFVDDHHEPLGIYPPVSIKEAFLNYKIGHAPIYNKLTMTVKGDTLSTLIPILPTNEELNMYVVINDSSGRRIHSDVVSYNTISATEENSVYSSGFHLYQNYPNPFNSVTTIRYQIMTYSRVNLKIFDILGREIETLVDKNQSSGIYTIRWDASHFSSGLYYCKLESDDSIAIKKLLVLK